MSINLSEKFKGFCIHRNVDIILHKPVQRSMWDRIKSVFRPIAPLTINELEELGLVVEHRHIKNAVVDAGEIWIAELLAHKSTSGATLATPLLNGLQYIGLGTGSTAVGQNQFALVTHLKTKQSATAFNAGANNKFTVSVTFGTTEGNGVLREAGIFAASQTDGAAPPDDPTSETDTDNRMFNRTVFDIITKSSDFELTLQWTIEIGSLTS